MNKRNETMDCRMCRDYIDDYVEGKLGLEDRLSFEVHLRSCSECRQLLKVQELTEKIINREKDLTPGYFLAERIMAGINNYEEKKEPVTISIFKPALIAVSVAAAIFAGVLVGNLHPFPQEYQVPVELSFMNDIEIESIDLLSIE